MKNYNILIVFILISILSGCGGKNYLGEKIVVSTTNLRLIEDNNFFLEQIGQVIESQQEQGEESEEIEKEENAGKDEDSSVDNITGLSDSIRLKQMGIEISSIPSNLIIVIFYYQIPLKPLKTLSLSPVSFSLLFPLCYIVPSVFTNSHTGKYKGKKNL